MRLILLIEDNEIMRENTAEILELSNYRVLSAANANEGLDMMKKNHPDLVISDLSETELNGNSELRSTRTLQQLPVIFLSGTPEKDIDPGKRPSNGNEYLNKPFQVDELLRVVAKYFPE